MKRRITFLNRKKNNNNHLFKTIFLLQLFKFLISFINVNYLIDKSSCIYYSFKNKDKLKSYWLINNAGSQELNDFQSADRGFGKKNSRIFDIKIQLNLLCGCSALIRREALLGLPLFAQALCNFYRKVVPLALLRNT